jgi:hypothetical protein
MSCISCGHTSVVLRPPLLAYSRQHGVSCCLGWFLHIHPLLAVVGMVFRNGLCCLSRLCLRASACCVRMGSCLFIVGLAGGREGRWAGGCEGIARG